MDVNASRYAYRNLTTAVSDKQSPLRRYLETRFPHVRTLQAEYTQQTGPLLVDGGPANPGTVGGAFDFMVRFRLDPGYSASVAVAGFRLACTAQGVGERLDVIAAIVATAGRAAAHARSKKVAVSEARSIAQACWVLALCTEFYRAGPGITSPLARALTRRRLKASLLMELAPMDALRQLEALDGLAAGVLLPQLAAPGRLVLGPTFDGSRFCSADADLIHHGLLLELKTGLGTLNQKTNTRRDTLKKEHLYQLVSYVLFDRSDSYALDTIGVYSARYGHLARWPLDWALDAMAGEAVNLDAERRHVWALLTGTAPPHVTAGPAATGGPARGRAALNRTTVRTRSGRPAADEVTSPAPPSRVRVAIQSDKVALLDSIDSSPPGGRMDRLGSRSSGRWVREDDYDVSQQAGLHPNVLKAYRDAAK